MQIKFETEALEFLHTTKKLPKLEKNPVFHLMLMLALSFLQLFIILISLGVLNEQSITPLRIRS